MSSDTMIEQIEAIIREQLGQYPTAPLWAAGTSAYAIAALIAEAREAGRREGLEEAQNAAIDARFKNIDPAKVSCPIDSGSDFHTGWHCAGAVILDAIRALATEPPHDR